MTLRLRAVSRTSLVGTEISAHSVLSPFHATAVVASPWYVYMYTVHIFHLLTNILKNLTYIKKRFLGLGRNHADYLQGGFFYFRLVRRNKYWRKLLTSA